MCRGGVWQVFGKSSELIPALSNALQNLCFTKKIRYESRKQLANARPRVRGQFVKINSTAVEVRPLSYALVVFSHSCFFP